MAALPLIEIGSILRQGVPPTRAHRATAHRRNAHTAAPLTPAPGGGSFLADAAGTMAAWRETMIRNLLCGIGAGLLLVGAAARADDNDAADQKVAAEKAKVATDRGTMKSDFQQERADKKQRREDRQELRRDRREDRREDRKDRH